ncbi:MAG TPA: hypothetical protein DEV97_02815 [Lachnospiraceae bacterium]|nr:hypothetical protein [Lachnospiraceae bacterium]
MKGYVVPREKPDRCINCLFVDRITYDCRLMNGEDYPDFESQHKNCPLVPVMLVDEEEVIMPIGMIGGYLRRVTE